jgi:TPR repeat protein
MAAVKELVEYYVARLSGTEHEDAWHRLAEAGPSALPHVIAAIQATEDAGVHVDLVRVLAQYRSAEAMPFLVGLLSHAAPSVWKSALDALVTVGGRAAVEALAKAEVTALPDRREWVAEATAQAMASLAELAEGGHAEAQLELGLLYAAGVGVAQDFEQAVTWLRKLADQGHAEAQYHLGTVFHEGEEAVEWFLKAAEQGHVEAQLELACRYEGAFGGTRDAERAVAWLRRAAECGHSDAQRELGVRPSNTGTDS